MEAQYRGEPPLFSTTVYCKYRVLSTGFYHHSLLINISLVAAEDLGIRWTMEVLHKLEKEKLCHFSFSTPLHPLDLKLGQNIGDSIHTNT